jgi:hypothetical protein
VRLVDGPFFNRRVTGPEAPVQVIVNGTPIVILANPDAVMVKVAASITVISRQKTQNRVGRNILKVVPSPNKAKQIETGA